MSSNLHKNAHYSDDNMHEVKGFPSAPNNSAYQKNIQGLSEWQRKQDHGNVISLINGYEAPPTEVDGDVYAILTPLLDVDAITWQSDTTVRFTFSAGYTNIYAVDNYLQVSGETNIKHDGVFIITAVNASYLEITNELIIDATDDVASASTASAYVSHQDFDPENLSNGNSIPRNGVVRYFSGVDLWYGDSFEAGDSYFNTTTTTFSAYDGNDITSTIDGIYAGSGTVPTTTIVTLTDTLNFNDGEVIIKGAGTTDATNALLIEDSSSTNLLNVRDDGFVGIGTATPSHRLDVAGGNFNVQGLSIPNLLYTDYLNDYVGIGTNTPSHRLDVAGGNFNVGGIGIPNLLFVDHINDKVEIGSTFNVAGFGAPNLLYTDYLNDYVGIGTNAPLHRLDVAGGNFNVASITYPNIFHTDYVDDTVIVEGNFSAQGMGVSNLFYVDYNSAAIGIGTNTPLHLLDIAGGNFNVAGVTNPNLFFVDNAGDAVSIIGGFNVSGFSESNLLFADYTNDLVGIGVAVPLHRLDVAGGNFNVGGSITTNLLFTDYVSNNVGIGTAEPSNRLHIKGAGADSSTTSLLVEDSAGVDNFFVRDDGMVSSTNGYSIGTTLFVHATIDGDNGNVASLNTFIGLSTPIGVVSGGSNGKSNTAVGYAAMNALTGGFSNTAIGNLSLDALTLGRENTALGGGALGVLTGASSVDHAWNTAVGGGSYSSLTTGTYNTGLGYASGTLLTSGSRNTMLGYNTGAATSGAYSNSIALGAHAKITASNQMVIGANASGATVNTLHMGEGVYQNTINGSFFKMQVTSITDGSGTDIVPNYTFVIAGSQGTGTGIGSDIVFQTAPAGTTGTTQNPLVTAMTIQGDGNVGIGIATPTEVVEILGNVKVTGQVYSDIPSTMIPTGTTQTIDFNNGNGQILDLGSATGDVTLTLNNPKAGATYFLKIIQDATTPRDLIYPASVKWSESTTPVVSTGALAVDSIVLFWDGATFLAHLTPNYG